MADAIAPALSTRAAGPDRPTILDGPALPVLGSGASALYRLGPCRDCGVLVVGTQPVPPGPAGPRCGDCTAAAVAGGAPGTDLRTYLRRAPAVFGLPLDVIVHGSAVGSIRARDAVFYAARLQGWSVADLARDWGCSKGQAWVYVGQARFWAKNDAGFRARLAALQAGEGIS
ncbi:MAG: hypothetical protein R8L07_03530 [Alphaproteobacteria bacterium]|nr:hypothetical protein [Alphaproteobacteria bacterium]